MTPAGQPDLEWRDGTIPVSRQFDDPYFSLAGGLEETRHVFLSGNALPSRLRDGFHIAELGFGTGLNLMASAQLWQAMGAPGTLRFTSFEAFPMAPDDMARAHAAFPTLESISTPLLRQWAKGSTEIVLPGITVQLILSDARTALPAWKGSADAWFLDGFSPAKNPELWSPDLMAQVARHTAPNGTFATYTAAGHVRRSLAAAGFDVTRAPGFAHKRHMTTGLMPATAHHTP